MANPKYVTLVANTVSTLTLDDGFNRVEVFIDTASASSDNVYFTVDGSTPTAQTDGTNCVSGAKGSSCTVEERSAGAGPTVKLKSAGTPVVMVRGTNL